MNHTSKARFTVLAASAAAAALLLSACGGSSTAAGSGGAKDFTLMINDDNHIVQQELTTLSKGDCTTQNTALPLKIQTLPNANVDQKVQLLAGQNALPEQFAAGGTPALTKTLDKAGQGRPVALAADAEALVIENVQFPETPDGLLTGRFEVHADLTTTGPEVAVVLSVQTCNKVICESPRSLRLDTSVFCPD